MKWLIGIAIVMVLAHLYFKYGARRLERERLEREAGGESSGEEDGR